MKVFLSVLVLLFFSPTWSSRTGNGRWKTTRQKTDSTKLFADFNREASLILGARIQLKTPDRIEEAKAQAFRRQANSLIMDLRRKLEEDPSFAYKKKAMINILQSMNMGFATRSNLMDFINKNQETKDLQTKEILNRAKELVDIIDNFFNIAKAKLNETPELPVGDLKISQMLMVFGRVNGEYTAEMVMDLVKNIEKIIDDPNISLRRISDCI